jgi:hypothetical protein
MHDAASVGVVQRAGQVADDPGRAPEIDRSVLDDLIQTAAFDVGHHEIMMVAVAPHLIDRHDPRVAEPGHRPGFADEVIEALRALDRSRGKDL